MVSPERGEMKECGKTAEGGEKGGPKAGPGFWLVLEPVERGLKPPYRRGPAGDALQAVHDAWLHPRPPGHDPARAGERPLHGREQRGLDPERARGGPVLGSPARPERSPAPYRRAHGVRPASPRTRRAGAGESPA